jgi:hypothetical protein
MFMRTHGGFYKYPHALYVYNVTIIDIEVV